MNLPEIKPKQRSLLNAVRAALGATLDKSARDWKLVCVARENYERGDPFYVQLQSAPYDHCYALKIVPCDEDDPSAVSISNHVESEAKVEEWADALWEAWDENDA